MSLIDEVRTSYHKTMEAEGVENLGPVSVVKKSDLDLPPGFTEMHEYYQQRLTNVVRRGYRHFAGSTLPEQADDLLELTKPVMMPNIVALMLVVFADGLMVGHQDDQLVKMALHFNTMEALSRDTTFREASGEIAQGFGADDEVRNYFIDYVKVGVTHLSHATGFAHRKIEPGKVWDLWMIIGTAATTATYLAGHYMGGTWKERDVLSGIEIASEEGSRGAE